MADNKEIKEIEEYYKNWEDGNIHNSQRECEHLCMDTKTPQQWLKCNANLKYKLCVENQKCHYRQLQQANAKIKELETMMMNSKIANEVIKACDLNFPIIIELQSKLNLAKTFLEGLLPFMTCLEFDNNLVKTFNFAQIAKNISETISKIKGENDA